MLAVNAVATEPFADFSVDRVSRLSMTRTYSSADVDYQTEQGGGVLGVGWHHEWEAKLKCAPVTEGSTQRVVCSVTCGLSPGFKFAFEGSHPSLDGSETWDVYTAYAPRGYAPAHRNVLVSRPNGEWIAFLTDGSELHFRAVCTACDTGTAWCAAIGSGGAARLVAVVDARGHRVTLKYDPAVSVPLALSDELGHVLELRTSSTCSRHATELRYDGAVVARYDIRGDLLHSVSDADGRVLRSYAYQAVGAWPYKRVEAVLNEAGTAIAEFSYDAQQRANGLVDASSSLSIVYGRMSADVTEHFRGPSGDTSVTSTRRWDWNRRVTSISEGCACGSARSTTWTPSGQIACSVMDGIVSTRGFDALGRVERVVERPGQDCTAPTTGTDVREATYSYGETKLIAQAVELPLDTVTATGRRSTVTGALVSDSYDHSVAARPYDPPGYACAPDGTTRGRVLCRTIRTGYAREASGNVLQRYATFYSYDSRGRLVRTYGPVSLDAPGPNDVPPIEERRYWPDTETPARQGRVWEVRSYANPSATPLVTTYDYDTFGTYRITRPDGAMTTFIKDGRGRPMFTVEADANGVVRARTETRYYDGLLPRLRVLPTGRVERFTYDSKGRLNKRELLSGDPEAAGANPAIGWVESYRYDASGNPHHTERADGQGHVTWQQDRAYDVQHRVVSASTPGVAGSPKLFRYSGGFLDAVTDEGGRVTEFTPDPLKRVGAVVQKGTDRAGNPSSVQVASYAFAPYADQLATVSDGSSRATSYSTDDFGRVSTVDSPTLGSGRGRWYRYDARGNVVAWGTSDTTAALAYDGLDRPVLTEARSSSDGSAVRHDYRYDERGFAGQLTTRIEPDRTVSFTYDHAGRVLFENSMEPGAATSLTTSYAYDAEGALRQVGYPSGLVVAYDRDPATGTITAVRDASTGTVFADKIETLPFGPVARLSFGNGKTLARTFNARYDPLAIESGPVRLAFTPSPEGGFSAMRDRSEEASGCTRDDSWSASRDVRDRLRNWAVTTAAGPGLCPAPPSPAPARWDYVGGTDLVASARDGAGRLTHAFGYDSRANVSAVGQFDAAGGAFATALCLRHDALSRLVMVGNTASRFAAGADACGTDAWLTSSIASFKYDALNRRVARTVNGEWTYFSYDGHGHGLSEVNQQSGGWVRLRDYVWIGDLLVGQVEYDPSGTRSYFAHVDHLGAPRALTGPTGQIVWSARGEPYGEVVEQTVPDSATGRVVVTNLRLPGQYDERLFAAAGISGLQGPYYNWNRWYLPSVGRYMELDPIALQGGLNGRGAPDWYNYALGNPNRYIDPEGDVAVAIPPIIWGIGAAIAAWETYVAMCTAAGTCPWSPKKCEPMPWNPPRIEPYPIPAPPPWDLGKSKNCGCTCLKSNGERRYIGVMRDDECRAACVVDNFNGYQCGGAPQFPYPPFN